jgi:hypothetical protein
LFVLGKNGEPKSGIELSLNLRLKEINEDIVSVLTTDNEGKVSLGSL